jgi:hypothetical protein
MYLVILGLETDQDSQDLISERDDVYLGTDQGGRLNILMIYIIDIFVQLKHPVSPAQEFYFYRK